MDMRASREIREMPALRNIAAAIVMFLAAAFASQDAGALPLFARQTGQECIACHLSFPELTNYGRMFKLTGYSIGERTNLPVSMMGIASVSKIADKGTGAGNDPGQYPKDGKLALESGSIFYGGKITDHLGLFGQWTYNNLNSNIDPVTNKVSFNGHSSVDNTDLRYSNRFDFKGKDVIYGFTLNNNPTAQDVFNTTPAFGFPFQTSKTAAGWNVNQGGGGINVPPVATQLESMGQQVVGLGAYTYINRHFYGELAGYRTANQMFSAFRAGTSRANDVSVKGSNPYWRFAYTHDWGANSVAVGTYGMISRVNTDNTDPSSPVDRFRDIGFDMQYQHISDPHSFSTQLNWIREKQDWDPATHIGPASTTGGDRDNPTSYLNTFKAKATYYYQRKYGVTASYFASNTSADCLQYANAGVTCAANGGTPGTGANFTDKNDTRGYIYELNYLPMQNVRIALQYTTFTKLQGMSSGYALGPDGVTPRNPKDNNLLYLYTWFAF
jgi:hypothetical protein